jgi:hypothetical protein
MRMVKMPSVTSVVIAAAAPGAMSATGHEVELSEATVCERALERSKFTYQL